DRAAFFDKACGNNVELRSQVQSLATSDENLGDFLEAPAVPVTRIRASAAHGETSTATTASANPLGNIGPYRVLHEIGRGGMGSVYLAEPADGQFRKRVAIKVVNPRFATDETLRRFRNERQVEAALEHPNIARLLDGGTTSDGAPYVVLEYVEGARIDSWCDG